MPLAALARWPLLRCPVWTISSVHLRCYRPFGVPDIFLAVKTAASAIDPGTRLCSASSATGSAEQRGRGHSLRSLFPPPAALPSLPRWRFVCIFAFGENRCSPPSSRRRRRSSASHLIFRISSFPPNGDSLEIRLHFLSQKRKKIEVATSVRTGVSSLPPASCDLIFRISSTSTIRKRNTRMGIPLFW